MADFPTIVKELNLAIKNVGMYPSEHPTIAEYVERVYAALKDALDEFAEVRLEVGMKTIVICGQSLDRSNEIFAEAATRFRRVGIAWMSFKRGLSKQELRDFLEFFSREILSSRKRGELAMLLEQKKIACIEVGEIDYKRLATLGEEEIGSKVKSDEQIWFDLVRSLQLYRGLNLGKVEHSFLLHLEDNPEKMARYFESLLKEKFSPVPGTLGVVLRTAINNVGNYILSTFPEERNLHIRKLADVISRLEPRLRVHLVDAEISLSPGEVDIVSEVIQHLPNSGIVEMMTYVVSNEGRVTDRLVGLFRKLVSEEERKKDIVALFGDSLIHLSGKEDSQTIRGLIENLFLSPASEDFISETYKHTLKELNEQIFSIGLLKEYTESLKEESIEEETSLVLLDLLKMETEIGDYETIAKNLGKMCTDFLLTGRYNQAKRILEVFDEEAVNKKDRPESKICAGAIQKIKDTKIAQDLVSALRTWAKEMLEPIRFILVHLGEVSAGPLLDALEEEKDMSLRKKIISIVVDLGEKAMPEIVKRFSNEKWYVVRNMVRILREIRMENVLDYLEIPLKHGDPRVRKEVIYTLTALAGDKRARLLSRLTSDPDEEVRLTAIEHLGVVKEKESATILLKILSMKNPFGRKNPLIVSAIRALGELRAEEAVPELAKILRKGSFFAKRRNDEVRVAAAMALAKIGNEAALRVIEEGTEIRRRAVGEACRKLWRRYRLKRGL